MAAWPGAKWFVAALLFAFCLAPGAASADTAQTKILYINSYHRGYSWSDGIEDGLRKGLEASGKQIELSVEYLDSRRFSFGAQIQPIAQAMAIKYVAYQPDLVLVSDNAAFDFAVEHRATMFPGRPIVFCGYNNFRPEVLKGLANITGVNEEVDVEGAVDMALKVHPKTRTLAFILSTADASSKRIDEVAEQWVFPKLRERFDVVLLKDASLEEIRQRLAQLPKNSLLFFCGQVRDHGAGRALTPNENGRLITAACPFPAYTFWDFHLNQGVIGGHIITGPDQGRAAASLALRVLDGTPADHIPVVMTTPTTDVFDYRVMQRFGISEDRLPEGAQVINRPFSLWRQYRWQILGVLALLGSETFLILVLLHIMRDRRTAIEALARERASLEERVHERTYALKEANEQLAAQSRIDSLTGLANRRHFDEVIKTEFRRLKRSGTALSLIMLDVDHFKNYNDAHGHVAGDDCLRRVGALINGMVNRSTDLAARYGGEEFAIVLPETDSGGAAVLAERIRRELANLGIPHAASAVADHVTASLGVVTVAASELTAVQDVIALADEQLYKAKSGGRNRVECR
jgi:diguanylate cyclase (GGDEF)-like protein